MLLEGGLGGRGNWHFKSPTRQTPRYAQPGIKGKEMQITLEMKVLADVGLWVFPMPKINPAFGLNFSPTKIADYEFTTLKPNLGIVEYRDFRSFVMADIPGIIEGAAQGKGLDIIFFGTLNAMLYCSFSSPLMPKMSKMNFPSYAKNCKNLTLNCSIKNM